MKLFLRVFSLFICFSLLFVICACDDTGKNETRRSGDKYIIYSDTAFAPFEYYDEDSAGYIGVDMDIMAAIADVMGFEYDMKNVGFDDAMEAVKSGEADGMIAGMTINEKRKVTFDFSDGYFKDGIVLAVAEASEIASVNELAGKTVAVKPETVGAVYADSIMDEVGFNILYFESSPEMYEAVENGSAIALFEDYSVVGWAIKNEGINLKIVGETIGTGYYGFAVKKGENSELLEKFNLGLKSIRENGTYDAILRRYGYTDYE